MRSIFDEFRFQISQAASFVVGAVFCAVGISSASGFVLKPAEQISFLLEPLGLNPIYDEVYWYGLTIVGIWLIMFYQFRLAAIMAVGLMSLKWAVMNGFTAT